MGLFLIARKKMGRHTHTARKKEAGRGRECLAEINAQEPRQEKRSRQGDCHI